MTSKNNNPKLEFEELPNQINEIKEELKKFNESILDSFMFQCTLLSKIDSNKLEQSSKMVKEYRKEKWSSAIEKANGNLDDAYEIYTKKAFFC